jgi:hypothetical protein
MPSLKSGFPAGQTREAACRYRLVSPFPVVPLFDPKWSPALACRSGTSPTRFQHVPRCNGAVADLAVRRRSGMISRGLDAGALT